VEVETHERGNAVVLRVHGRLDAGTSAELDKQLNAVIDGDHAAQALVLDFSPTVFISSAGLRVLLAAAKKLQSARRAFLLCGINADIMEVFKMTGFHRVLRIHDSVDDALAGLG
jgi:anti-anti-sigma factor